jgi:hypothetical protein
VLRIVVREGLSLDLAEALVRDLRQACDALAANPPSRSSKEAHFHH